MTEDPLKGVGEKAIKMSCLLCRIMLRLSRMLIFGATPLRVQVDGLKVHL